MFYGKNLQVMRMLHGLSRKELGEKLCVSEQSIWQFEKQMIEPSFENILQMKEILQVKSSFFFEEFLIEKTFFENNVAYRKADISSRKKTNSEVVYLNVASKVISYLESFLNVPPNKLLDLRQMSSKILLDGITNEKIEEVASLSRKFLGIQLDNGNLLLCLEKAGIYVLEKNIGGKADAYSSWSTEDVPIIVLGMKKSAVRRNFDLAHELGHLLLHSYVDFSLLDKNERQQVEREADYFSSCFLLPSHIIQEDLEKIKKISNPDSYISLKTKYNVSIQALEMRAYKLGFLTPKQHSYFYRQIAIKDYRLEEPLDREIVLKRPGKIRSIFNLVLTNRLTDLQSIENNFRVNRSLLEGMFSIEPDFFIPFAREENFTDFNNVLKLNFGSL
ncbi:XRE family transcriptional regulator [Enterococcus gallinarum]|uniref:spr1629 family repressor/antitoxin n=1 Tax=Enterococcus gallinarum TaxID=1353 RepID=UPI0018AA329B|nr:XRE family transcriptional regulator [Enterococcus gallinarum]